MKRIALRLRLAYLRFRIREAERDCLITASEMDSGPKRLKVYKQALQRLRDHAALIEQRLM